MEITVQMPLSLTAQTMTKGNRTRMPNTAIRMPTVMNIFRQK